MSSQEIASHDLGRVLNDVALHPAINGDNPENIGWEEYFVRHPHYIRHSYGLGLRLVRGGRELINNLEDHKQKLGGAIIRSQFTDKEIEKYGREEI